MGFFSSLTGAQKTKVPASGYYAMPQEYQDLYSGLLKGANSTLLPGGQLNSAMFTPMAQTEDESRAFDMARTGFAPTEESLRSDIAMQMNPYDDYVIQGMNREATGQNSLVNQYATRAGQQGSNRSFLGTSDVEQNRLNSIGQFRQGQYNTAVQNALGPIAGLKQQDMNNLLGIGDFQRNLDMQTKQAPYTALMAGTTALGSFPSQFGNFGSQEQTIKTGGGLGGLLSGPIGQLGMSALGNMGGFGLATGGQSFFNGGLGNMFGSMTGRYGPGF